jgi:nitrogen fixation protein FixH
MKNETDGFAAFKWGTFVVLLLGSQVAIGVVAIFLAGSDPTVAVVPGYHKKALMWDESVQLRQSSQELGWKVELRVLPGLNSSRLQWTVTDREGDEVDRLHGRVVMFHHARAGEPIEFRIEDKLDGIELDREGYWQVEMTLDANDASKRFFDSKLIDVRRAT